MTTYLEVLNLRKSFIMILEYLLIVIGLGVLYFYGYFVWQFNYWSRKGIYTITPKIPYGNFEKYIRHKKNFGVEFKDTYDIIKGKGLRFGGVFIFARPVLLVTDIDLVNSILRKDFEYFTDRIVYRNNKTELLAESLFRLRGAKWAAIRARTTSSFGPNKLKSMVSSVVKYAEKMCVIFDKYIKNNEPIEINELNYKLTIDMFAYLTFGFDANSMQNPDSDFFKYSFKYSHPKRLKNLITLLASMFPRFFTLFNSRVMEKEIESYFIEIVKNIELKGEESQNNSFKLIDNLLNQKNEKICFENNMFSYFQDGLTVEEIAATAFALHQGASNGCARNLTFFIYEIAAHPEIQEIVRNEIDVVLAKNDYNITYEGVTEMEFLNQCYQENSRKNATSSVITRECTKPYKIPDTDVVLPKGEYVVVSMLGIHRDPDYYPNPDKYDPERFSKENISKIKSGTYLPFSMGPRTCIGQKLAVMVVKIVVITILRKFRLSLNTKTKSLLEYDKKALTLEVAGGVWLNLEKI